MTILNAMDLLVGTIGESDCETLGNGFLAQPVNAASSLSYAIVGVVIIVASRRSGHERCRSVVYGSCVVAIGLGSVMYHGPQIGGSHIMHDLPILITVLFIVNHDIWLTRANRRGESSSLLVLAGLATLVTLLNIDLVAPLSGVTVTLAALAEFLVHRRGVRHMDTTLERRTQLGIVAISAIAGASWVLGRTGGPVCDPESLAQFHGLWHVISSGVFGAWWWLALASHERDRTHTPSAGSPRASSYDDRS